MSTEIHRNVRGYRKLENRSEDVKLEPDHLESTSIRDRSTDNLAPSATSPICNNNALYPSTEIIGTFSHVGQLFIGSCFLSVHDN